MLRNIGISLALVGSLGLASPARAAAPLPTRDGEAVRVVVNQKARSAVALRPRFGTWRLQLVGTGASTAEIVDVTPGTPARMVTLAVDGGELVFDDVLFSGGHVYQVRLKRDKREAIGFVYLHPAQPLDVARPRGPQHLSFGDEAADHRGGAASDDGIAPVPKSGL